MSIKSTCSKSMGDLLLRGWAMLAENCPRCQVPLMRDPKTQDRLCVNCDRTYPAGQALKEEYNDDDEAADEHEEEQSAPAAAQPQAVAVAEHGGAGPANGPDAIDDAPWRRKRGQSDKAAELLSEKMLQGWALLETCCPRCSTPLVRNKAKEMMCVTCQARVVPESEAPMARGQGAPASQLGAAGAAGAAAAHPTSSAKALAGVGPLPASGSRDAPKQGTHPVVGRPTEAAGHVDTLGEVAIGSPAVHRLHGPSHLAGAAQHQHQHQHPARGQPALANASGVPVAPPPSAVAPSLQLLSQLAATIESKLWQVQSILASTPASDTTAIRAYTATVSDCLDALARIRQELRQQQHSL